MFSDGDAFCMGSINQWVYYVNYTVSWGSDDTTNYAFLQNSKNDKWSIYIICDIFCLFFTLFPFVTFSDTSVILALSSVTYFWHGLIRHQSLHFYSSLKCELFSNLLFLVTAGTCMLLIRLTGSYPDELILSRIKPLRSWWQSLILEWWRFSTRQTRLLDATLQRFIWNTSKTSNYNFTFPSEIRSTGIKKNIIKNKYNLLNKHCVNGGSVLLNIYFY